MGLICPHLRKLVANGRTEDEICEFIGADRLIFQRLGDLISAVREGNSKIYAVDASCFDGQYVTGDVTEKFLSQNAGERGDDVKRKSSETLDFAEINSYH